MIIFFSFFIALGLIFQKKKYVLLLQFLAATFIIATNFENADYNNYLYTYESINNGGLYLEYFNNYEYGYKISAKFFNRLGLSYHFFRCILLTSSLFLITLSLWKSKFSSFLFSTYLIFSFLLDIVQVRNFVSMGLITIGLTSYFSENNKQKKLNHSDFKLVAFLISATLFQVTAIFYLVTFIAFRLSKVSTGFFLSVLVLVLIGFYLMINEILNSAGSLSYTTYIETSTSLITFTFLSIAIISYAFFISSIRFNNKITAFHEHNYFKFILISSAVFTLIFVYFNVEFFRIFRNLIPTISIVSLMHTNKLTNIKKFLLLINSCAFFYFFIYYASFNDVLKPILIT